MSTKARGTKRTCQNSDCGVRFYDLDRNPVVCPVCNSKYVIAASPVAAAAVAEARKPIVKKPEFKVKEPVAVAEAPEAESESEDALPEIETADDDIAPAEDETFLEEEEDGGDVSNILGGPVAGEGEEP